MVHHLSPETHGCKHEPDDEDTVQALAAIESQTQIIQRNDKEFVLQFAGRLSLRGSAWRHSTEFKQHWRTVADPSFEHLTFGANSTAQQANSSAGVDSDAINNLACPFLKHDPAKYRNWKCCNTLNGWPTVPRVKEHLYRKHLLPKNICLRCREHYRSEDELAIHQRTNGQCEIRAIEPHDGIDEATEKKLKSRVRDANLSEEAKWTKIYKLLFPQDALTPSPFHKRSMADINARFKAELSESLCHDYSRLSRSSIMEMFTTDCTEGNGIPDPEKIIMWSKNFALESIKNFNLADSTSSDQKSTTAPGLSDQTSLHFTGTTSGMLGFSSQTSLRHNQQITETSSTSDVDPQFLSSFWGNSSSIGVDPTQFNVNSFFSTDPSSEME